MRTLTYIMADGSTVTEMTAKPDLDRAEDKGAELGAVELKIKHNNPNP